MCGISGVLSADKRLSESDVITVNAMSEIIKHRGPDGKKTHMSDCGLAVFSHRMLSIVDVGQSPQPMSIRLGSESEVVVNYNGEIYNFKALREELICKGHSFSTRGDTEVLLKGYLEWGVKCLERFDGDFAIAIYDSRNRSLFLARDRLGVKPLYFSNIGQKFFFCSEPKGFSPCFSSRLTPDHETIADFFLEKDILTNASARPDKSFYRGVSSVEAGQYLIVTPLENSFRVNKRFYWEVPLEQPKEYNKEDSVFNINQGVINSVLERVPSEVAYGALLSGGLDSSLVTSILLKNDFRPTIASINFSGSEDIDWRYANLFANTYDVQVRAPELSVSKLASSIDSLIESMDEPHDTSRQLGLICTYEELSKSGCKVALVGEGADEFNYGYYHTYPGFKVDSQIQTKDEFVNACLARSDFANQWLQPEFVAKYPAEKYLEESIDKYFLTDQQENYDLSIQHYYIKRFLKYRLDVNDRCGMHHGIEARVPYCDHELVKEFLRVPKSSNVDNTLEKLILRDAFNGHLHDTIRMRSKYAIPENNTIAFHRRILNLIRQHFPDRISSIWDILNIYKVKSSIDWYEALILSAEAGTPPTGALKALSTPTALSDNTPTLKAKHFFLLLNFFIWNQRVS